MRTTPVWAFVPADYGDAAAEHDALTNASAQVDECAAVVAIDGPDAAAFLHGQLSADVEGLAGGSATASLVLTPQGRLQAAGTLVRLGAESFRFVTDRAQAAIVAESLTKFLLRVDATIDLLAGTAAWAVVGPSAANAVAEAYGVEILDDAEVVAAADGTILVSRPGGLGGVLVVAATGDLEVPGVRPAGREAVDALRIETQVPRWGVDYDATTIPHEAGLVPAAVSLDKGCYTGQELIERIHTRGHPNRHPQSVRFEGDVPQPGGEAVAEEGKFAGRPVGRVTTTAWCFAWNAPGGLGVLRRELEGGDHVVVGADAVPATVVAAA